MMKKFTIKLPAKTLATIKQVVETQDGLHIVAQWESHVSEKRRAKILRWLIAEGVSPGVSRQDK